MKKSRTSRSDLLQLLYHDIGEHGQRLLPPFLRTRDLFNLSETSSQLLQYRHRLQAVCVIGNLAEPHSRTVLANQPTLKVVRTLDSLDTVNKLLAAGSSTALEELEIETSKGKLDCDALERSLNSGKLCNLKILRLYRYDLFYRFPKLPIKSLQRCSYLTHYENNTPISLAECTELAEILASGAWPLLQSLKTFCDDLGLTLVAKSLGAFSRSSLTTLDFSDSYLSTTFGTTLGTYVRK